MAEIANIPDQATVLGNPPLQLTPVERPNPPPDAVYNLYNGVTFITVRTEPETAEECCGPEDDHEPHDHAWCLFEYQVDHKHYDTGFSIIVEYTRNKELSDCAENRFLDDYDGSMSDEFFFHSVLPHIDLSHPILRVVFGTVDGRATVHSIRPCELTYPLLPSDAGIDLPIVPISSIVYHRFLRYTRVDLVEFDGQLYAFKHDEGRYDPSVLIPELPDILGNRDTERLVKEVAHLTRFDSSFIIKPLFLVSDTTDPLRFRGYLTPYFRAGSLSDVLSRLHKKGRKWLPPRIDSLPPSPPDSMFYPSDDEFDDIEESEVEETAIADKPSKLIDWPTKQLWASDILRGVVVLHDANSFSGDITLRNLILGTDGRIRHIGVYPQADMFPEEYAPPEFWNVPSRGCTAAHDMFTVGLTLWALSEEIEEFRRASSQAPRLFWQEGDGATPQWYRSLVENCVQVDAEKRPSERAVLDDLMKRVAI